MHRPSPAETTPARTRRRGLIAVMGAALLFGSFAGPASAKEVAPGGSTTCNPVRSLSYKGDARVGETGLATVRVSYGVKSCDGRAVAAAVTVFESAPPNVVALSVPAAPLDGQLTVPVRVRVSYTARVEVTDAATGALVGTRSIFAGAVPKGV